MRDRNFWLKTARDYKIVGGAMKRGARSGTTRRRRFQIRLAQSVETLLRRRLRLLENPRLVCPCPVDPKVTLNCLQPLAAGIPLEDLVTDDEFETNQTNHGSTGYQPYTAKRPGRVDERPGGSGHHGASGVD